MFLDFEKGHWLSIYRSRCLDSQAEPLQTRSHAKAPPQFKEVSNRASFPIQVVAKLLLARIAMGLGSKRTPPWKIPEL
jgi:hypothetical protein